MNFRFKMKPQTKQKYSKNLSQIDEQRNETKREKKDEQKHFQLVFATTTNGI